MASLALVWDLIARDNASPAFTRVGAAAESAAAKADTASASIGGALTKAAKVAGAAGLVFAGVSLKMAADFQSATTRLVTSANETQGNLKMVQQGLLDMAGQVGYSTEALTTAMYKVESGGQHGADALLTLKAAAQGAKTENADLTTVADALTSVLTDYHLKASDAADVTSKLVAATASGKMTFEELSGSLAAVLPVASANHVALNDILGDLASMTMHGMSAEQASQNLADTIRHLAAPTQQQQKEFAALGLTTQQVTADLGEKGLSGTIGVITDAIKKQMGPGTTQVVLDLNTALQKLPPAVQALGQGVLDGTISLGEWRQAVKALPAEQAVAAQSFMALVGSTHQIGNETKDGAEIYQSYSGALRQALGDATGMNVALMIGGENAGNTATAIANVSAATHEAGGNVRGWSEIQGTFNQQLSEFVHSLEAMTIKVGERLLPAMTTAFGWMNDHALPALRNFASAIGDVVHSDGFQSFLSGAQLALHTLWDTLQGLARTVAPLVEGIGHLFGSLPGPIQAVTVAVAGFAIALKTGMLSFLPGAATAVQGAMVKFGAAIAAPVVAVQGLNDEMALQQRLMQMEAQSAEAASAGLSALGTTMLRAGTAAAAAEVGLTAVQTSLIGLDAALAATVAEEEAAIATTGGLSGAMSILAQRGMGAALSGAKGLMGMLGGPMGLALIGVTVGVMGLESAISKAEDTEKGWTEALKEGGKAADDAASQMAQAQSKIDALNNSWQGFTLTGHGVLGFLSSLGPGMNAAQVATRDAIPSAQDATKAYNDWYNSLNGVDKAQQDVKTATADLITAQDKYGPSSLQANEAAAALAAAQDHLKTKTDDVTNATRSHIQALQDEANAAMASANSSLASEQANLSFTTQLKSYEDQLKAGTLAGDAQTSALISLTQSGISAAQAAGQMAVDQAKANGITDDGTIANQAILKSLQDTAAQFVANGQQVPAAIQKQIDALINATNTTDVMKAHVEDLGITTRDLPDHTVAIDVPTVEQMKRLHELGDTTVHLPNGNIVVYANTDPALKALGDLIHSYDHYTINLDAQVPGGHLVVGKSAFAAAEGALLSHLGNGQMAKMFASGGLNPMSASSAAVVGANTWRVIGDRPHGDEAFIPINNSARSQEILSVTASRMGYGLAKFAAGGFYDSGHHINGTVYANTAHAAAGLGDLIKQIRDQLNQQLATTFAPGAPSSVSGNAAIVKSVAQAMYGWGGGAEWNALYNLVMRESGFRNTAQNPTSTAYGMFQFLNSTWAGYGPKTSDPSLQARYGLQYIHGRYGDPLGAWGHETRFGWYDNGGWLAPGLTMAYNGTGKPERIRTAEQESALGSGTVVLQLDGPATVDLLEGRAVRVATSAMRKSTARMEYSR